MNKAKQAGLFVLFGTLLFIPRIRRLRRRVVAWTCVRLAVALGGGWMVWRFVHAGGGVATLACGGLFLALSLLVRAKPEVKSLDVLAREMNALIVLNGGMFRQSPDLPPVQKTQIFVHPDQIIVLGPRERRLLEIPLRKVQALAAHPVANGAREGQESWEVEVKWLGDQMWATTFHYDGAFAEHLARVAESVLRSQWKKDLPVLQS